MAKIRGVGIIYQPHFNTKQFRVDVQCMVPDERNFIVITCSPEYNGAYTLDGHLLKNYSIWHNNGRPCYCIPISDCKYIKPLENIKTPEVIKEIKKQQNKWSKSEVKNHYYASDNKKSWML